MKLGYELSIDISEAYGFNKASLEKISENKWVKDNWPVVYFIRSEQQNKAYIGESANFSNRIKDHLRHPDKIKLNQLSIIGSDKFHKSATLEIESKLIQYISAEGTYELLNGNFGLINHTYYQQDQYSDLFKVIWDRLISKKIVSKSLEEIENSELFKYSPYKSLSEDQYNSVINLIELIASSNNTKVFVKGSAGTGKTILATYLIKLLSSNIHAIQAKDLNENEKYELELIQKFQHKYPKPRIGLVIAMTSLRATLKNVFKNVPDLKSSMVISPSESFKKNYDLLLIDEAHRLRQYKNIGWRGAFKKNNQKLGLDDSGTELDWIIANSKNQIFFYDSAQSVKPSDIDSSKFSELLSNPKTHKLALKSQMRCQGGVDYISFIDRLLWNNLEPVRVFESESYELVFFDSMKDLYENLKIKEKKYGLCRLIAGYAWEWKSATPIEGSNEPIIDIELDGLQFQWNTEPKDWINSSNAFNEVGCIHTTQGYDLNYAGIIFGWEIDYNPETQKIEINENKYFDKYGKIGAKSKDALLEYIINIYKTILFRGIKGTYIYACNTNLRTYLKSHIKNYTLHPKPKMLSRQEVIPYVNAVPVYDLKIAAGDFSNPQQIEEYKWMKIPEDISVDESYFVCQVIGESMNKIIPNGAWCIFKKYEGGSRNGEIVLVQHSSFRDAEYGAGYTVKEYYSNKIAIDESWVQQKIILRPKSYDPSFNEIVLNKEDADHLTTIGIFKHVL